MTGTVGHEVATIVNTLLIFAEQVFAVASDLSIANTWSKKDDSTTIREVIPGLALEELFDNGISAQLTDMIASAFAEKRNGYLEYADFENGLLKLSAARVLPVHPDHNFIFLTLENLSVKNGLLSEDIRLKRALEVTGDGVWDIDFIEDVVSFSDKWHKIFGYNAPLKMTVSEWRALIHPDDIERALSISADYISGKTSEYSAELRFRCADGTYKWIWSRGFSLAKTIDGRPLRSIGTHTDIHERKVSEEKYATVTSQLYNLINNFNCGILVTDENHRVSFANHTFCQMYDVEGGPEAASGLTMEQCFEKSRHLYKYPDQVQNGIRNAIINRLPLFGREIQLADGRILSLDFITLSFEGRQNGEIWKFTDITALKQSEQLFREQREFYENIIHNIPADIAVFATDHRYLFVNKHGIKNDELREWIIGKTDADYARFRNRPDSFYEARFPLYDQATNSKTSVQLIEKLVSREGNEEHHLRIIKPVLRATGDVEYLLAYGLNITDLIRAQELLKASADTFSSAFDNSGIGMALVSIDGNWLDVNAQLCQMTGYTKEELLERTFQEITHPDDLETDLRVIRRMLRKEIRTYSFEKRYLSKANKVILVQLTVSLVWNADDTPRFFIAQVIDITGKKQLEDELKHKNRELEDSKVSLLNKVKQLEELSYIIAHNLRGPASNIKMFSEIVLEELASGRQWDDSGFSSGFSLPQTLRYIREKQFPDEQPRNINGDYANKTE